MNVQSLLIPAGVLADPDLRPTAKLVLARLLKRARGGGLVFVSRADLGRDLNMRERTVESGLRELQRRRLIIREVSHGGRGRPRGWRVLGAALRLVGLRAVPAGDEARLYPPTVRQLTLFDLTNVDKQEDRGEVRRKDPDRISH